MRSVHELKESEKIPDGMYLELIRAQLLKDMQYTRKDIKRAQQRVMEYEESARKEKDERLKKAMQVHAEKYAVWVNDLQRDMNLLEQLYLNTKLKMCLGGFTEKLKCEGFLP